MDGNTPLKSAYKLEKEATERKIYDRFNELASVKDSQILEINKVVMAEFGIHSATTINSIRKRVKQRITNT